ncbi:MAG: CBS domain-containing protein [Chloroflexota bacterium]|nr:CBS domain-containing protein [Chloroflexota bacterium]
MKLVKDLMVPIEEYATVNQEMTIREAVEALEQAQEKYQARKYVYKHRALLVLDNERNVVGKLSQLDIVMNMEPKYRSEKGSEAIAHTATVGFSPALLKSMMDWYSLWNEPFEKKCREVLRLKVKDCMYTPRNDEYVQREDSLEVAIHQLVMGRHQSLLVTGDDRIVGVLRLTDVFQQITLACKETPERVLPD